MFAECIKVLDIRGTDGELFAFVGGFIEPGPPDATISDTMYACLMIYFQCVKLSTMVLYSIVYE